jgi:hypothetical protein
MRRRQRYTVHRRLLLTFLLLGCAGSFVLGQELARAFAAIPVYAAQSLTFSGAGITASLVTPIQAPGAIGQPTPQPKVVKHPSKPDNKPKGKSPPAKPVMAPQQTPVKSPPIVLQGTPVAVSPTTSPCASALCLPGVMPPPSIIPAPSATPTGVTDSASGSSMHSSADATSSASPSETPVQQCALLELVTHPATTSSGVDSTRCSGNTATDSASSTVTPTTVTPGVIEAPSVIGASQVTLPPPVAHPVVPVVVPVVSPVAAAPPTLAPTLTPTETSTVLGATSDLTPTDTGDQTTLVLITTAAAQSEQESQG